MAKKLLFFWILIPLIIFGAASVYAGRDEAPEKAAQEIAEETVAGGAGIKEAAARLSSEGERIRKKVEKKAAHAVAIRQQEKYQDGLSEYIRHVNHAVSETEADAMAESFIEYARQYDVDEKIVMAVAQTESAYCADAVSCADFKGLMQTGDYLAESAGHTPSELFDPEISIKVGAAYIRDKIEEFGDIRLALTAYNQGSGSVHSGNYSTGYAELTMERAQALEEFLRGRGYPEENSFLRNGDIS